MDRLRFQQLWARNVDSAECPSGDDVFTILEQLYAHPSRCYHAGGHIDQCLLWLDRYADWVSDPDAVELALWFHDACYSPDPRGHEARGAKLFRQLSHGGISASRQNKICDMILYTTHNGAPQSDEEALLVDIDLASFSRPWHRYVADTAACRAERREISDLEFCRCQVAFLQAMLARPCFYFSHPFREHHEADARHNMQRMIRLLQKREQKLLKRERLV
ncbi:HD domain-containing protein [Motiliproteus sediminis]|uniref:HD domain-containing protein n=1 Tax=Motiliproteus sediminis TaxID=1468178 RepID=UPI001AEF972B|nr:hypothetical protein [Motiliproteus sediminis]